MFTFLEEDLLTPLAVSNRMRKDWKVRWRQFPFLKISVSRCVQSKEIGKKICIYDRFKELLYPKELVYVCS